MIRASIRRPVAISMAYLAVAALGLAAWRNVPVELLPDTRLPRVFITASWPGASPETTEAFLTSPLEAAVQQVRGVEKVTSESSETGGAGQARVTAEFSRDVDMDFARLELSERLAATEDALPRGIFGPNVRAQVPDAFQEQSEALLAYTLTGPYTLEALRTHVDEIVAPELRQVDGVADVVASGGRARVLEIDLDEARIRSLGLSLQRVASHVRALEDVREAGSVTGGGQLRTLSIRERPENVEEILRAPLLNTGGRVVRLADVARVRMTWEEPSQLYRIDGRPAVTFSIYREIGSNAVAVADAVKARVALLEGAHPSGVRILIDRDQSKDIRAQLSDLRFRALFAAGVIFLVLLAFLRSTSSAAIVFATIAFSILITVNLIYFAGYSLNVLTLMGLAMGFGLIVDNAIVVLENVYRHRRRGEAAHEAAERGAREVVLPILAATLTTLVVLIPFVYLQGELRVFYVPLAIVVGFSLVASLFVAFTFIPALAARSLGAVRPVWAPMLGAVAGSAGGAGGGATGEVADAGARTPARGGLASSPLLGPRAPLYVRVYRGMVGFTLRHPWVTVLLAGVLLGGSWHLFDKYVNRGIVWGAWWRDQTYVDIRVSMPRGEEMARTDELIRFFEGKLAEMPEVETFTTNVYPNRGTIRVEFPEALEQTMVPVAIKEQLVAYSHLYGGAEVRVYGFGPSFYGGGSSPPNYSIKVLGYNYEMVREIAEDLGRRLQRVPRIRDVNTNSSTQWFQRDRASELVLRLDRRRLAQHGLSADAVVREVGAAIRTAGGTEPTNLRVGGEELRFAVKLAGHEDIDRLQLLELLIPAPGGAGVRLGNVATIEEREVLARIRRENQQYERTVAYEFRGPTKLGDLYHETMIAATALPPGYSIEARQQWRWSEEEKGQIFGVLAISILLVFMVTAALFESLRQPVTVLLTVPMALVGVFLIFFYTGANFTREAYVGVIMMGGIVVNNAILLVDHVNQVRRSSGLSLEEALLRGTLERVRPILMTSATTILGLLPLVLFAESANANIWNALGYALIGGLTSSTLFVLTITPALYLLFERGPERRRLKAAGLLPPAPPGRVRRLLRRLRTRGGRRLQEA
ncbi:MAG TPA: efflux RND transporter permease subunit [Longimicrobiales bacterium]|nr:efflux RND transporter permease subunit [Longimicrobiales bacterium]